MKDVLLLHELGIPAIAPNSETQNVSDKMFEELKSRFKYIVYVYDNDLPGISNMVKFKSRIQKQYIIGFLEHIRLKILLIFIKIRKT